MDNFDQPAVTTGRSYWQPHVDAFLASGFKNKRAFCRQTNIAYENFLYWFRRLTKQQNQPKLIPVTLSPAQGGHCVLELSHGYRLTIQSQEALACLPELLARLSQ